MGCNPSWIQDQLLSRERILIHLSIWLKQSRRRPSPRLTGCAKLGVFDCGHDIISQFTHLCWRLPMKMMSLLIATTADHGQRPCQMVSATNGLIRQLIWHLLGLSFSLLSRKRSARCPDEFWTIPFILRTCTGTPPELILSAWMLCYRGGKVRSCLTGVTYVTYPAFKNVITERTHL